jgi:DNA-binding transcriptional ArsR family regulator
VIEEHARDDIAFDEILASRARPAIVAFLAGAGTADFAAVRDAAKTTGSNAGIHLRTLEDAGYAAMQSALSDARPRPFIR